MVLGVELGKLELGVLEGGQRLSEEDALLDIFAGEAEGVLNGADGAVGCHDALCLKVLPVFVAKQQLDTFATELCREAEISGRVGSETNRRAAVLREKTGIDPDIIWSDSGELQLNQEVTVIVTLRMNIGLFDRFGSFPVTLRAQASRKSEVYWK